MWWTVEVMMIIINNDDDDDGGSDSCDGKNDECEWWVYIDKLVSCLKRGLSWALKWIMV